MLILAKLIGIIIAVLGIVYLVSPKIMKQVIGYFDQDKKIYVGGVVRLLFAIILLLAASQCRLTGIVVVLGILFLVGGVLVFSLGMDKEKAALNWLKERPDMILRLFALIPVAVGVLLIYSI